MKHIIFGLCLLIFTNCLLADTSTLTVNATATTTAIQNSQASASNSTQIVIATNVTAQILHLHDYPTGASGGSGYLIIQVNGLNFKYTESAINAAVNNKPVIIGPATITLIATVNLVSQGNVVTGQDNMICTISTTPDSSGTNQFIPNTGIVIPADSGGPVNIILESSVDLINWIPADPGTYGTTTSNRFFRVRATR